MEDEGTHDMQSPAQEVVRLDVEPLSPKIGGVIHGIDLGKPISSAVKAAIYEAFLDRKVIFFRDQDITTADHIAFGRLFGDLEVHPFAKNKKDAPEVIAITHDRLHPGRENQWHSDVTWREKPSLGSILRAIEVPEVGGDTLFANMEAAYEALSDELKQQLEGLQALHDFSYFRLRFEQEGRHEEIRELESRYPNPVHPVVRTHPDTGRKSLYVNRSFTMKIVGMEAAESKKLLRYLFSRASIPEHQCRFRWKRNSIAFWDNRSCQHYAASDYWPEVRRMERVTVCGARPV